MTGDTLITKLVNAYSDSEARTVAQLAPAQAIREAADLLYLDDQASIARLRGMVTREARA